MAATLKSILIEELKVLLSRDSANLVHDRIEKFSAMGVWKEEV